MLRDVGWRLFNTATDAHRAAAGAAVPQALAETAAEVRKHVTGFQFIIVKFDSQVREAGVRKPPRKTNERQNQ